MSDPTTISLRPAVVHFEDLVQGDDLNFTVALTDENGAPVNISGDSFKMQIRRADNSVVKTLTTGGGITITGTNTIYGSVPAADTASLEPDYTYNYDIQWTLSGSLIRTIVSGRIRVYKQITV